ncbi:MAG: hypothetical protein QOK35_410 [Pseudonocardiales bacterium]|nr:hypothetical protein [Pseudonocardiales bacterium]
MSTPLPCPAPPDDGLASLHDDLDPAHDLAPPHRRLAALLDRQAGVVGRAQALAAGLAPREVDRLLARRLWCPVHPRVYRAAGRPLTDEARVRAAVLWAGDGAVVVGAAAVWWHGITAAEPATVGVAVPRRCPGPRPGVVVRRQVLPPVDVVSLRGLAVAVRPLALLDAAVEAGAGGAALLRRALGGDVGVTERDLRAVAGSSAGPATAARLITAVTSVVTSTATPAATPIGDGKGDVGPTCPRRGMVAISESLQ